MSELDDRVALLLGRAMIRAEHFQLALEQAQARIAELTAVSAKEADTKSEAAAPAPPEETKGRDGD